MKKFNSLTGMIDFIESSSVEDSLAKKLFFIENTLKDIFNKFYYSQIRTPSLESTELFLRSVGDTSDIINKELFEFKDKNDKSISLRPEGTAGVIRSIIQRKVDNDNHKLFYLGQMWRYERPQKGRYREFNQAGVEILGYDEGLPEFEMISVICSIIESLKIKNSLIKINHLGNKNIKQEYCKKLLAYMQPFQAELDEKDQERLQKNPLRVLDSKNKKTKEILLKAPKIIEFLPNDTIEFLKLIKETFADKCEIVIDPNLVRGLDYYTGIVFEAISSDLGSQDAFIGGGRYDELCEQLGGKKLPAIGMAMGLERIALLCDRTVEKISIISFIIISSNIDAKAYKIAHDLRLLNNNVYIDVNFSDGSLKSKLRRANKDNAKYAIIIGDDEIKSGKYILKSLKDDSFDQKTLNFEDLKDFLIKIR